MKLLSVYPLPAISYAHDGAACLASEDGVLYAYEEERLLRFQHAISEFPERASVLGFQATDINPEEVDRLIVTSMERCWTRSDYNERIRFVRDLLHLQSDTEVECIPHHMAHSALAVLSSPFEECVFVTMDGGGDGKMGHWGVFRDGHFEIVEEFDFSPAILYSYVTTLAGFPIFEEGKTMGLSGYGQVDGRFYDWLCRHFRIAPRGARLEVSEHLRMEWESNLWKGRIDADSFRRHKYFQLGVRFVSDDNPIWMDDLSPLEIAQTGQLFFEELVAEAVSNLVRRTGITRVACSGGAFLNVLGNARLHRLPAVAIYVPMAPHDAGLALGAALLVRHHLGWSRPEYPLTPYLGPSFSLEEIESLARSLPLACVRIADPIETIARAIANGRVVGWFHDRGEYGARALGARSVLADPRDPRSKARLNQLLKKRDWFMPYAPSILEEYGHEFFMDFRPCPYMNIAFRIRPEKAELVPPAVHVDGSCRAHSVDAILNPRYHALITKFHEITGIPMVLNTSFNRHGVPMVATPRQAIQHLVEGNLDLLAFDGLLVERKFLARSEPPVYAEGFYLGRERIRFAAELLRRHRTGRAIEVLAELDVPVKVAGSTLVHGSHVIWDVCRPAEDLDVWWQGYWEQDRICKD